MSGRKGEKCADRSNMKPLPLVHFNVAKESKHHPLRIGQDHDQEVSDGFATNCCVVLLVILSVVLCVLTFPFSLIFMIRVSTGTGVGALRRFA